MSLIHHVVEKKRKKQNKLTNKQKTHPFLTIHLPLSLSKCKRWIRILFTVVFTPALYQSLFSLVLCDNCNPSDGLLGQIKRNELRRRITNFKKGNVIERYQQRAKQRYVRPSSI